jgi:hypothetical protein
VADTGERTWRLGLDVSRSVDLGVRGLTGIDWSEVDRAADVLAAWLGLSWKVGRASEKSS